MSTRSEWFGVTDNYQQAFERIYSALTTVKELREIKGFKAGKDKDGMPVGFVVESDRCGIIDTPNTQEDVIHVAEKLDALAALIIQDAHIRDAKAMQEFYGKDVFPQEPWDHALLVTVKTSRHLPGFTVVLPYAEGPDDSVIWQARGLTSQS